VLTVPLPAPPPVLSTAGAQLAPFHFRTSPVCGTAVLVSTSLNASMLIEFKSDAVMPVK